MFANEFIKGDRTRFVIFVIVKMVCWMLFFLVFMVKELNYIDMSVEYEWFLSCDVLIKVAYCLLFFVGNIRVFDVVRDEEMVDIECLIKM